MDNYQKKLQLELIARGDHEEIMEVIRDEVHYSSFCIEAQIALVKRGNPEEIKAYREWRCFNTETEDARNQLAIEILNNGDHTKIMEWITIVGWVDVVMLVKRGNHEEIMAYMDNYCFNTEGLVALIEHGNHEEIMNYLDKYGFSSDEAQIALVKRNNATEVRMAIRSGYFTCENAIAMLKKLGYQSEIDDYDAMKAESAFSLAPTSAEPSDAPDNPDFEYRVIPPDEDYPD